MRTPWLLVRSCDRSLDRLIDWFAFAFTFAGGGEGHLHLPPLLIDPIVPCAENDDAGRAFPGKGQDCVLKERQQKSVKGSI